MEHEQNANQIGNSPRSRVGATPLIIALVCLGAVALGMWFKDREQADAMNAERAQMTAALNQTLAQSRSQIQELNSRIDMFTMAQAKAQTPASRPAARPARKAATAAARRKPVEVNDPRVDRLQGQLADTQQELARQRDDLSKTRDDLNGSIAQTRDALAKSHDDLAGQISSTRTDLSGSIAKTHDEVVALRKRGEQNIYEFQLGKTKQFQRVGPLSVALRSTSTKHKTYDLAMIVEDNQLSKKHVNLYEPVWIRLSDRPQAVELVVNRVDKDHISGYLSEPKYKRSELAASSEKAPEKPLQLETR